MQLRALAVSTLILTLAGAPGLPHAQDAATDVSVLPERVLFVVSGGFWEEAPEQPADAAEPTDNAPESEAQRGYYRLAVLRGADNTSKVFLQQMALTPDGPQIALTTDIEEINGLNAYVTDVRRDADNGQQGFSAFVYLKADPALDEADMWTVHIDDFGDLSVEKATN